MDVAQHPYKPSKFEWNFHHLFIHLFVSDLPTVRQFLLKQIQLKCVLFGGLKYTEPDLIYTVKVLKCYNGITT